jgi:hydrogenase maturation protein HypF
MNGRVRKAVEVAGIVQGVGFRPYVYRLAIECHLAGFITNTAAGVSIEVEGPAEAVEEFVSRLPAEAPRLARITQLVAHATPACAEGEFRILASRAGEDRRVLISPDVAICDDCLHELFDPSDRRFHYPFINCTNCGPRYTIVRDIPYDRARTSMAVFPMCADCQREYDDPLDRRFHAQPNACWQCGPQVELWDATGVCLVPARPKDSGFRIQDSRGARTDPIAEAAARLQAGYVVAVKGLGGFHLAVDATNPAAVSRLREGKRRVEKPFAIMASNLEAVRNFCHLNDASRALLESPERPIVLLHKKLVGARHGPPPCHLESFGRQAEGFGPQGGVPLRALSSPIAEAVAPFNLEYGVFLPYTPLHYLLFAAGRFQALVMTSGNISEEPIAIDNAEAVTRLRGIADFFLVHNRDILLRCDDSVVRVGRVATPLSARQFVGRGPRLSELPTIADAHSGSAAPTCGKPPAFRPVPHPSLSSTPSGRLSLPDGVGEVVEEPRPSERQGLSASQSAKPQAVVDRTDLNLAKPGHGQAVQLLRRSRGYVPVPVFLDEDLPPILAVGGELKNTVCLTKGRHAFLSQHIGDLENLESYAFFETTISRFQRILEVEPQLLAYDLHPDYFSTRWALSQSGLERVGVQHHHAHVASCMAENHLEGKVIGIALDGTGYGTDGAVWGGEVLLATYADFERMAHLDYVPMPGGAAAITEPWRMAASYLHKHFGEALWEMEIPFVRHLDVGAHDHAPLQKEMESQVAAHRYAAPQKETESQVGAHRYAPPQKEPESQVGAHGHPVAQSLRPAAQSRLLAAGRAATHAPLRKQVAVLVRMAERGVNSPLTSSCGRLFDAVSALAGIRKRVNYEAQAAIELEAAIAGDSEGIGYPFELRPEGSGWIIDTRPLFDALVNDLKCSVPVGIISRRFHEGFGDVLARAAKLIQAKTGIDKVCLSGGSFQNVFLLEYLRRKLEANGLNVFTHSEVPCGDGGLSLGQALVAAHRPNPSITCG